MADFQYTGCDTYRAPGDGAAAIGLAASAAGGMVKGESRASLDEAIKFSEHPVVAYADGEHVPNVLGVAELCGLSFTQGAASQSPRT